MAGGPVRWDNEAYVAQAGYQAASNVAVAPDGTTMIVWEEVDSSGLRTIIKAKVVSFDGEVIREPFQVNVFPSEGEKPGSHRPSITVLSNGNFAVSWDEFYQNGSAIKLQFLDPTGQPIGATKRLGLLTGTSNRPEDAEVGASPNKHCFRVIYVYNVAYFARWGNSTPLS